MDSTPETSMIEEIMLGQLVMLQRIYDVQMAALTRIDETLANEVYDLHAAGMLQNPDLVIPDYESRPAEDNDTVQKA